MENLGKLGCDKVTGFEGIIIAKAVYLYSQDRYLIQPKSIDSKSIIQSEWISCERIEIKEHNTSKCIGFNSSSESDIYDIEICSIESEDELG